MDAAAVRTIPENSIQSLIDLIDLIALRRPHDSRRAASVLLVVQLRPQRKEELPKP